jgi:hypothetical protein
VLVPARDEQRAYIPPEEWVGIFEAWVGSHSGGTLVLPDGATERESVYGDHGR